MLVTLSLFATALAAPAVAVAAPGGAHSSPHQSPHQAPHQRPNIDDVQKKLGRLALQNTQLVEQYNQARVVVDKRNKAARAAQLAADQAATAYSRANLAFTRNMQQQYQSGDMGATGALFDSQSGPNYLDKLQTLDMISSYDADVITRLQQARKDAASLSETARTKLAEAKQDRDALVAKRKKTSDRIDRYRTLLASLSAQQRAQYAKVTNPSVAKSVYSGRPVAASAAAKRAVNFALDQVGEPYVFGAAGPDAWDCSGLTQGAWAAGGVALPHSALEQYNYGTHVSMGSLSPGDLIFMYSPIGHVTIYIGDGMMVSAPTEGQPVTVVPVSSFGDDIVGATHLG